MRPVDIGIDAARALHVLGPGRVRAIFSRALYLQVPGGLVVLATTQAPRGPLHLRVASLPAVTLGCPVLVDSESLRIGDHAYLLDSPVWSPRLPPASSLRRAQHEAQQWLPDQIPTLDVGSTARVGLPARALIELRRGDLLSFAAVVGGRGPGLTPAGDDMLAGVLLVAHAMCSGSRITQRTLLQCAHQAQTNDVARAFLVCAARGRCIEAAHELLTGLAEADHSTVRSAVSDLRRFGSTSGAALTYGIRAALLAVPAALLEENIAYS